MRMQVQKDIPHSVFGPGFGGGNGGATVVLEDGTTVVSTDGGNAIAQGSDGGALLTGGGIRASLDASLGGTFWRTATPEPLLAYDAASRALSVAGGNAVTLPVADPSTPGLQSAEAAQAAAVATLTRAGIAAAQIPATVQALATTGYAIRGDGGAAAYVRVVAEPAHAAKVRSGDGAWWEIAPMGRLDARQVGAVGDGITDDRAALADWVRAAVALGVTAGLSGGTYLIATPLQITLAAGLDVACARGAVLKAGPGVDAVMLRLTGVQGDPATYPSLAWQGGLFDTSQAAFVDGDGSGSALQPRYLRDVVIRDAVFTTRTPRDAAVLRGDSGITPVEVYRLLIEGCTFYGHPDAGVYLSGDSGTGPGDDGGFSKVIGCDFEECDAAVTAKRQVRESIVVANTIRRCTNGIDIVPTGDNPLPGRRALIAHNTFKKIATAPIDLRGGSGFVVQGNLIEDWGYEDDGFNPIPSVIPAIRVFGATDVAITGNVVQMVDWVGTPAHQGVRLEPYVEDATTLTAGQVQVSANRFRGVPAGIRETAGQGPTFGAANVVDAGAIPAAFDHGASLDLSPAPGGGACVLTGARGLSQPGAVLARAEADARYAPRIGVSAASARSLTPGDAGAYLRVDAVSEQVFTLEAGFVAGDTLVLRQIGAGAIRIAAGTGVTVVPPAGGSPVSGGPGTTLTLICAGSETWDLGGDTAAA